MTQDAQCPEPGIYENVPFADYLLWQAVSNSSLNGIERSPLHYKQRPEIEETEDMRFGTLCHCGRLEPSALFRNYVVMPDLTQGIKTKSGDLAKSPRSTEEYAQRVDDWMATNAVNKTVVSQASFDAMVGVVAALDRNDLARQWFTSEGPAEVSIVWDDPDTGIRCKSRLDKLALPSSIIADLKTTRDCLWFQKAIAERRYYRQGAMYIDGVMVLTGQICRFGLVAVENVAPFGVMAAPLAERAIEAGREEYKAALATIAEGLRTNHWPGYTNPPEWTLPAWHSSNATESVTLTLGGESIVL